MKTLFTNAARRRGVLYATAGVAALAFASPVLAQTAPVDCPDSDDDGVCDDETQLPSADGSSASDGLIVVTGSRIRRDEYSEIEPITVITGDEITQAGFASATDVLQSNAVAQGSSVINNYYGGFVINGGTGVNTLGLRNLGPGRTLVLLNGHRLAPAGARGSLQGVDLNTLPTAIIQRIEVLKAGASSVYGSDAIAGVVNLITKDSIDGLTINAQVNVPEMGAGVQRRISASAGGEFGRFRILGSIDYYKRDAVTRGDADWAKCPIEGLLSGVGTDIGSGDFIDPATGQPKCFTIYNGGVTINTLGVPATAGVATGTFTPGVFTRLRPNGNVTAGPLPGYEGVGLYTRDSFTPLLYQDDVITPTENYVGYLEAGYDSDILGNADFYVELLGSKRKSTSTGHRQLSLDYLQGSPLLPEPFRSDPRTFLASSDASGGRPVGARAFISYGLNTQFADVDFARVAGGARGDFFVPEWRYDFYVGKSFTDSTYGGPQILRDRIGNSVNVVPDATAPGGFACADPGAIGCVAAPALTAAVIGGNLPQAWRDYIEVNTLGTTEYREFITSFGVDGPLFALPGGDAQVALGAEYREASIDDTPDVNSQLGNVLNFTSSLPTRGSDNVWEVFGEVFLPLLSDVPFAETLSLSGSGRYTEYQSYGGDWTYKVAGEWAPFDFIGFRASYGTSFRAPALFEQFLGATSGFLASSNDPCDTRSSTPTAQVAANCLTEGLTGAFVQNSSVRVLSTGNAAGLLPETSDNLSAGVVLTPPLGNFGDLSISIDYFDIEVNNAVSRVSATTLATRCYNQAAGFALGVGECANLSRDAADILTIIADYRNIAASTVAGFDGNLRFSKDIGPGTFVLNAAMTHYLEQKSQSTPDTLLLDFNDAIGTPKWVGTFDAAYQYDNVLVRYGLNWVDATNQQGFYACRSSSTGTATAGCINLVETTFYLDTPDYFTHDLSFQWDLEKFRFTAGVRNLFDTDPPRITGPNSIFTPATTAAGGSNAPADSNYDFYGRTFFVNTTFNF